MREPRPDWSPFGETCLRLRLNVNSLQGRSEGGSWGARDPPFVSLFLSKQPTIFRGKNAMTILFDTVWPPTSPPPFEKSWLRSCTLCLARLKVCISQEKNFNSWLYRQFAGITFTLLGAGTKALISPLHPPPPPTPEKQSSFWGEGWAGTFILSYGLINNIYIKKNYIFVHAYVSSCQF